MASPPARRDRRSRGRTRVVEPRVSARLYRAFLRYLGERLGPTAVQALAAGLTPSAAATIAAPPSRSEWVSVRSLEELLVSAEAQFGDPETHRLLREMTRTTMAAALSTVWSTFLAEATPESMLDRAPLLWQASYDTGNLQVVERGARRARLRLAAWPDPPQVVAVPVAEACAVIIARMGVGAPRAVEARISGAVEIEVSWEAS